MGPMQIPELPSSVTLIAVSKKQPIEKIKQLYDRGVRHFGESYLNEYLMKKEQLPKDIKWHFIGALQTNKIKKLLNSDPFMIHSVSTEDQLLLLNRKKCKIFLQVNISNEESKQGIFKENVFKFVNICSTLENVSLQGLMMIGTKGAQEFKEMLDLKNSIDPNLMLSMGMSDDHNEAIKYQTSFVRLGTLLFGPRN